MPKFIKKCRICGTEYEACITPNPNHIFRWQDVACCPEHGEEYLRKVLAARAVKTEKAVEPEVVTTEAVVEAPKTAKKSKKRVERVADIIPISDEIKPDKRLESEDE